MTLEEKNKRIEEYINNIAREINTKYGVELIDSDKKSRAFDMFKNSNEDLETEIIPKIEKLARQVITDYIELQQKLTEMMKEYQEEELGELATLDLHTEKNGIYLSEQQIDLLMITELNSLSDLKNYVENICGQFPNKKVEDIIPEFYSLQESDLEIAKKILYSEYQKTLISYLENAQMSNVSKAKAKLEKLGINGQELEECLQKVSVGNIREVFTALGEKYGTDFITKFNHLMNDDFEDVKDISYEEMQSLSELIMRDETIDTIIIATGKYNNSIYPTLNGQVFDPYLTEKALNYCIKHNKHMRYHALFDQMHIENLLRQGKGLKDHDEILRDLKLYIRKTMDYIESVNRTLPDGTMVINTVEIFNELVERNKPDKSSPYEMVWEKYFGITTEELVSCFDGIKKREGVEFMYNETTLTESPQKRKMVEQVLFEIEQYNPNLIDTFGDQMHLSDEDIITKEGRKNLTETAKMLARIQEGKVQVNGELRNIKPKNTECTEHDFHFTPEFLKKVQNLNHQENQVDMWAIKRAMQSVIAKTYVENGVKFQKSTYWSLMGKNDHNVVRANIKIEQENIKRQEQGLPKKPLIDTMYAGLLPDGKLLTDVKTLRASSQTKKENNYLKWNFKLEKEKYELIKAKNQAKQNINQNKNNNQLETNYKRVLKKPNNDGFASSLLFILIIGLIGILISVVIYIAINK